MLACPPPRQNRFCKNLWWRRNFLNPKQSKHIGAFSWTNCLLLAFELLQCFRPGGWERQRARQRARERERNMLLLDAFFVHSGHKDDIGWSCCSGLSCWLQVTSWSLMSLMFSKFAVRDCDFELLLVPDSASVFDSLCWSRICFQVLRSPIFSGSGSVGLQFWHPTRLQPM